MVLTITAHGNFSERYTDMSEKDALEYAKLCAEYKINRLVKVYVGLDEFGVLPSLKSVYSVLEGELTELPVDACTPLAHYPAR